MQTIMSAYKAHRESMGKKANKGLHYGHLGYFLAAAMEGHSIYSISAMILFALGCIALVMGQYNE